MAHIDKYVCDQCGEDITNSNYRCHIELKIPNVFTKNHHLVTVFPHGAYLDFCSIKCSTKWVEENKEEWLKLELERLSRNNKINKEEKKYTKPVIISEETVEVEDEVKELLDKEEK